MKAAFASTLRLIFLSNILPLFITSYALPSSSLGVFTDNTNDTSSGLGNHDSVDLLGVDFSAPPPVVKGIVSVVPATVLVLPSGSSSNTQYSTGALGPLSSTSKRDISRKIYLYSTTGSIQTKSNYTAYPTVVNQTTLLPFFRGAQTQALAYFSTQRLGNESNTYFRYTANGLSMVAESYGTGSTGTEVFNWGDFATIAEQLANLTMRYPDNNKTWLGNVKLNDNVTSVADFFVVPSIIDVYAPADSSTAVDIPTPVETPHAMSSAPTPPVILPRDTAGDDRLAKRGQRIDLGNGYAMTMRVYRGIGASVLRGLLYDLAATAMDQLLADSGLKPTYEALTAWCADPFLRGLYSQNVYQIAAESGTVLARTVIINSLQTLIQYGTRKRWDIDGGSTSALYGELYQAGRLIARWSLGTALGATVPCAVVNPDGSIAYACFQHGHLQPPP